MSSGEVFMWGEPYSRANLIQRLRESCAVFAEGYPRQGFVFDPASAPAGPDLLADSWIANLYPPLDHLVEAHRAFLTALLGSPARAAGYSRWGLKEVRLGGEEMSYLRFLFSRAKFLIIYRNPLDAYRSYLRYRTAWYYRWPDQPVLSPGAFGLRWREQLKGLLEGAEAAGAEVIRFEDLVSDPGVIERCENYLDLSLRRSVMETKLAGKPTRPLSIHAVERLTLRRAAEPLFSDLGYGT